MKEEIKPYKEQIGNTGGLQRLYKFENGYGASIINGIGTYTNLGEWELAVIKFKDDNDYVLCYDTEITNDIIGYLSEKKVLEILNKIRKLKNEI